MNLLFLSASIRPISHLIRRVSAAYPTTTTLPALGSFHSHRSELPSRTSKTILRKSSRNRYLEKGSRYLLKVPVGQRDDRILRNYPSLVRSFDPRGRKISPFFFLCCARGGGGGGGGVYSISRRHSGRFTSCRWTEDERGGRRQRSVARVGGRTPVGMVYRSEAAMHGRVVSRRVQQRDSRCCTVW